MKKRFEISTFGGFIKVRRKFMKINQTNLAELSGVCEKTIREIENNKGNPTMKNIISCLKVLGFKLQPTLLFETK